MLIRTLSMRKIKYRSGFFILINVCRRNMERAITVIIKTITAIKIGHTDAGFPKIIVLLNSSNIIVI